MAKSSVCNARRQSTDRSLHAGLFRRSCAEDGGVVAEPKEKAASPASLGAALANLGSEIPLWVETCDGRDYGRLPARNGQTRRERPFLKGSHSWRAVTVSNTHLRAHETGGNPVCRL